MATKRKRSPDTQQLDDDDFPLPGTAILLQNLSLPSGVLTTNAWGDLKEQPVTVSLELRLRDGFDTAAGLDQLDDSTIHYGELAKRVRAACKAPLALEDMLEAIEAVVRGMSRKASGRHVVRQSVIDLNMGKASMFGSGLVVSIREWYNADGTSERVQSVVTLNDVRTMTLVGINQYERSGTQPVDVTLALWRDWKLPFPNQSGLERMLIETIQGTSYETLETLVHFTMDKVEAYFEETDEAQPGSLVRLRLAKPQAVGFADAPAVEVCRRLRHR